MQACPLALLLALSAPADTTCPDARPLPDAVVEAQAEEEEQVASPSALRDQALVYGATLAYAAGYGHVRKQMLEKGSLSRVWANFRDPIGRAVEGARSDRDPWETNYVAHPVSWGVVGYYLRSQGHSFWSSLAMSQGHSVFWEYVIEGSYARPSGKDMITNFGGSVLGILLAGWLDGEDAFVGVEVTPVPPGALGGNPRLAAGAGPPAQGLAVALRLTP